ncbi:MAG: undecaprenyl-diphosphatase UppP [Chthonomonadales bacterium]
MTDFHAAIYGLVQGLTEFLPVSSSAHLRIVPALLGWEDAGAAYTAIIQWGTLLAALIYFRKDIFTILFGKAGEKDENGAGRHLLVPIIIGTIPIAVVGLLLKKHIENEFRSLYFIGINMILFAIILGLAERRAKAQRTIDSVTNKDGLIVGLAQMCSLMPGASRSGTTITGALFIGLERSTAARFSFLLGLPAIFAAGLKELIDGMRDAKGTTITPYAHSALHARPLIIASVVAFVVGWISIDWLLKFLKKNPTYVFIAYRIIAGLAIIALVKAGTIH